MNWLDDLKRSVQARASEAFRAVTQSPPARMAGRALNSSFVRPTIGFKPEIAGIVASEFLPKDNPIKNLVDTGLYLASGPLNMTLMLGGDTPQSDDTYGNWRRLGYKSREDMVSRVAEQQAKEQAIARRVPGVSNANDYGPPRPVKYGDGTILVGNYQVDRFNPAVADAEVQAPQPQRDATPPSARRPVEERRPPVSREVPVSPTPQRQSMNELAQLYARQRVLGTEMAKGGELQRRLYESGAAEGMPAEKFMTWVEANPDLAYRLAEKRGLLPGSV
jgi:hypothetical protein